VASVGLSGQVVVASVPHFGPGPPFFGISSRASRDPSSDEIWPLARVRQFQWLSRGASPTDKWMALVKLASLFETRSHAVAADSASHGATLGTVLVRLERTSVHLFIFQRALYCSAH